MGESLHTLGARVILFWEFKFCRSNCKYPSTVVSFITMYLRYNSDDLANIATETEQVGIFPMSTSVTYFTGTSIIIMLHLYMIKNFLHLIQNAQQWPLWWTLHIVLFYWSHLSATPNNVMINCALYQKCMLKLSRVSLQSNTTGTAKLYYVLYVIEQEL